MLRYYIVLLKYRTQLHHGTAQQSLLNAQLMVGVITTLGRAIVTMVLVPVMVRGRQEPKAIVDINI